jgi:glycosyltransferase involved in cell wall biosynthesis
LSLLSLLSHLDCSRYEPIVCSSEGDSEVVELFSKNNFATCDCRLQRFAHTTGGSYNMVRPSGWYQIVYWIRDYRSASVRLEKLLRDLQPDLVHFNSLTLAPYTHVPARMKIPNVVHVRESVVQGIFGIRRTWLTRHLNRYASRVIAICRDNLGRLELDPGRGQVIYNPIDFRKFDATIDKQEARSALGIAPDAKVALFAGGSVPDAKGLREYLEAMGRVIERDSRAVCLMPSFVPPLSPANRVWNYRRRVGWLMGIYRKNDSLARCIERGALGSSIVCSSFTFDIEQWIAASDVICAPHILPHFSRTVVEAGAMKKPVIAFRVGGIEEVVDHWSNGLLVEIGDVAGLAGAILQLFANEEECRRMGENGWQQARNLFDAESSAAQVADVYKELLFDNYGGRR